ncbi:hypothetical protein KSP40_PGU012650 [Platanthera guangdongensis]|uniref:Uncharacterized protein n=1 Tax=Platanthera guangdongensis TaxID=2320717 RepID=A0ABR2N0P3_9ASPA
MWIGQSRYDFCCFNFNQRCNKLSKDQNRSMWLDTRTIQSRPSSIEGCFMDIMIPNEKFLGIHTTEVVTRVC